MYCRGEPKLKLEDENSVLSRVDSGDTLRMGPSSGRALIPRCPHLLFPGSIRGGKPRHWGAMGWIRGHTSLFCAQSVGTRHGHRVSALATYLQEYCGHWGKTERSSLPAQPCLVICPLHCRGSSGNTVAVPDGTPKISQLRGPTDSHLSSPTSHSGEQRGAATSFFSHPKEINMLCKNNSNQQSSTLHLPPSGPSLLAFH